MNKLLTIIILILSLSNCQVKQEQYEVADVIFENGTVYSVDTQNSVYEAVAVKDGKIVAVGKHKEVHNYRGDSTKIVDLRGGVMFPGLIEGHAHIMSVGDNLLNIDLMQTKSYEEIVERVKEKASQLPEGAWILGRGWHQDKWVTSPEKMFKGFPTHDLLSEAVPNHPVFLRHASGHACLANIKAMELAKVSSRTPDPKGGEIFKDLKGNPTGLFNEIASQLIRRAIPPKDATYRGKVLKLAIESCLEQGITSFHQAGSDEEDINTFKSFDQRGELKIRLYVMLNGNNEKLLDKYFEKGPSIHPEGNLTIRAVKLSSDGALGSRGAWLLDPYSDAPDKTGMNITPMDYLEKITLRAAKYGFQVCTHAIGDRGVRETLNIYEKTLQELSKTRDDHRFRIEHAQHVNKEDLPRFKTLGVIPAMQAIHLSSDRPWAINRLGKERIEEGAYIWQKFLQQGTKIVNGTDAPVEPINPFASLYASVSRKTLEGKPDNGYEASQKMTREQAIRSYTIDAAYGAFEERVKGSIEIGKLADFVVLDKDIMTIEESEILKTKVMMTVVGGEILYQN